MYLLGELAPTLLKVDLESRKEAVEKLATKANPKTGFTSQKKMEKAEALASKNVTG